MLAPLVLAYVSRSHYTLCLPVWCVWVVSAQPVMAEHNMTSGFIFYSCIFPPDLIAGRGLSKLFHVMLLVHAYRWHVGAWPWRISIGTLWGFGFVTYTCEPLYMMIKFRFKAYFWGTSPRVSPQVPYVWIYLGSSGDVGVG